MPYIPHNRRKAITTGNYSKIVGPGELNFQITDSCIQYLNFYGESYSVLNELIGVLECVKLELYRRVISEYEDIKRTENGDVY